MSLAETGAPALRYLTPTDVAERLSVSRSQIYALIRRGELPAVFVGRLPRVAEAAFAAYLERASAGPGVNRRVTVHDGGLPTRAVGPATGAGT